MIDITLFLYQLVAFLTTVIMPLLMILAIVWFIGKVLKGFIRSLVK